MARKKSAASAPRTGGATADALRKLHERAREKRRIADAGRQQNALAQPQNRWQRAVRYNWDKNRGRG